ncbi:hypothetical protein Bca4012_102994 [Brassica carinata]
MESGTKMKVAVTFKGSNYLVWSRMVKTAVGSKGLWKHITSGEAPKLITQGGDKESVSEAEAEKWQQEDLMVMSVLHASLEPSILDAYSYCETAKELWETLKKVYGNTSNLSRVFEVKKALNGLAQEDMEFTKHLGRFRTLWSELEMLRPSTTDPELLNERREQDKVFGLLLTLNPSYNGLIKHVLRAEKLPDLEDACAQIQKEQGSIGLFGGKGDLSLANAAQTDHEETPQANKAAHSKYEDRKFNGNCDHCKKHGHKKSQCWILHPHLKPAKFMKEREARAHASEGTSGAGLTTPSGMIALLVYVDDIIITGSDKEGIIATKEFLKSMFEIKDLGEMKYFLGIEICRSKEGLFMSQRKYTLDLLKGAGAYGGKTARMPMEDGYKVPREGEIEDSKPYQDPKLYRKLVGKLIYLTITRPDICFAVNQVSQHMQVPKEHHWRMVERILMYLNGSPDQGVWMGCNGSTEVVGYCDADWAGDRADRRSTTGYCTFIGGNLVTWKSKKQKVVSCSSAEAEYRAMLKLTNELVWIKGILKHLEIDQATPMTMHCDNQAAIHIASNSVFHERTKHIEVDCHKVRQMIILGVILPCYTRSEDQLADVFTKAARHKTMESIHIRLGLIDLGKRRS